MKDFDTQVIIALQRKLDEIEAEVNNYKSKLDNAQRELVALTATIKLFECSREGQERPAFAVLALRHKRGELADQCFDFLDKEGPLDTRELTTRVIRAKGLDESDAALRKTIGYRVVHALGLIAAADGQIIRAGKRKGVCVWPTAQ